MNSDTITPEFLYNSLLLRISVDERLIGGPPRMSGADSTTEVTPTGRYEDHSLSIAKLGIKPPKEAPRTKTPKTCETSPWFPSGKGGLFRPQELHRQLVYQALGAPCGRFLGSEPFRPESPSGSSLGRQV